MEQSQRFLECVEYNPLTQLVRETTRDGTLPGLLFHEKSMTRLGSVVWSLSWAQWQWNDRVLIPREVKRELSPWPSGGWTLACLRRLADRVPWEAVLKGTGVQEHWTFFQEGNLKVQEQAVPLCRKTSGQGRPTQLTRELWLQFRGKKGEVYGILKKKQVTQEDYKDDTNLSREKIKEPKSNLNLIRLLLLKTIRMFLWIY